MRTVTILAILALAGCASSPAEIVLEDTESCTGFGFRPGTDAFANCRLQLEENRKAREIAALGVASSPSGPSGARALMEVSRPRF